MITPLADQVRDVVDDRDRLLALASEVIATLVLDRNAAHVDPLLRELAEKNWGPQLVAVERGVALSDQEIEVALAVSGVDVTAAVERMRGTLNRRLGASV